MSKVFKYHWQWQLTSPPEKYWELIADTNRFNFDTKVPKITRTGRKQGFRKELTFTRLGIPVVWSEEPFEWVYPERFGVVRRYSSGPVKEMRVLVELHPHNSGTLLTYDVEAVPANLLGYAAIPVQIGIISARQFDKTVRKYDKIISANVDVGSKISRRGKVSGIDENRLNTLIRELENRTGENVISQKLRDVLLTEDDLSLIQIRPYVLAGKWNVPRKKVLEVFLHATRAGILDLKWNLLCPQCRGSGEPLKNLREIHSPVHCESCDIDYTVNFEQLVEITFMPNSSVRKVEAATFCIGGPQVTPHIVAQKILQPGGISLLNLKLQEGSYRFRTNQHRNGIIISAIPGENGTSTIKLTDDSILTPTSEISPVCVLQIMNNSKEESLCIFERVAWADNAVTAKEVTTLQVFRDLFATEALESGEQISVGSICVLFTDLKNSTRLYREIGDATAFGYVMNHFEVLRKAVSENNGALVKTIGDAVMAVFIHPEDAVKSIRAAVKNLKTISGAQYVRLKAGIHYGPAIAVNLNNNLDYFGSTVNIASRLEGLSGGDDLIVSQTVFGDVRVAEYINRNNASISVEPFETKLKGFEEEKFDLWRIRFFD